MNLRKCQVNAIEAINNNQNGIVEMCCGSGKSLVIAEIIKQYSISILFVPKNALFNQFVENPFYYTNDYTTKLLDKMYSTFSRMNPMNLVEDTLYVYGEHTRMATSIFRIHC